MARAIPAATNPHHLAVRKQFEEMRGYPYRYHRYRATKIEADGSRIEGWVVSGNLQPIDPKNRVEIRVEAVDLFFTPGDTPLPDVSCPDCGGGLQEDMEHGPDGGPVLLDEAKLPLSCRCGSMFSLVWPRPGREEAAWVKTETAFKQWMDDVLEGGGE